MTTIVDVVAAELPEIAGVLIFAAAVGWFGRPGRPGAAERLHRRRQAARFLLGWPPLPARRVVVALDPAGDVPTLRVVRQAAR